MTEDTKSAQYHWEDSEGVSQESYNASVIRAQSDVEAYMRTAINTVMKELRIPNSEALLHAAPLIGSMVQATATEFQTAALMKQLYHLNCNLDWIGRKLDQIQKRLDDRHD